jgi:signal transduction histidine kinase
VRDHGGTGIDAGAAWTGGKGLAGMRERASVYGGRLRAAPTETGFSVEVRLPLGDPAA